MSVIFKKTAGLTEAVTHYCPGCTHGIAHRLVAEVLEELGLLGETIGCASVGCGLRNKLTLAAMAMARQRLNREKIIGTPLGKE